MIEILKKRFEDYPQRHEAISWRDVEKRLSVHSAALAFLQLTGLSGGNEAINTCFQGGNHTMKDTMELIRERHSVRQYLDKKIPEELREMLNAYAAELNDAGGLHMQILYDEPECFSSRMAHYGKFENANNYIAMIGKKAPDLEERCGYYGELLVLKAQELSLNTCWAALTHGKSKAVLGTDEKEVIIIALGFGKTQGIQRKSKSASDVSNVSADSPAWFRRGVEAALLAPTAINQQKFRFELTGDNTVSARAGIIGTNLKTDLGIVKCHFELGAGKENIRWR